MSLLAATLILAGGGALPAVQSKKEMQTGSNIPIPRRARIPEDSSMSERLRGRIVMSEFARCVIDRNPTHVASALAAIDGPDFSKAVVRATSDECLSSGMIKFKVIGLRGPLFAELYRRKALAEAAGRVWGPPVSRIDLAANAEGVADKQHRALLATAHCVVEQDRPAAAAVVRAPTASDGQNAAIAAITPALGACLPQGTQVRVGKESLEGGLAEVLYRGVVPMPAPEPVVAPGAKQ